ncbi:MAG: hypothetical protein AAF657_14960 [Acidobacteriota bacterium]
MTATFALLISLAALAISTGLYKLSRRASRARRELSENLHDRSLALDIRCDELQHQLDTVTVRQRIHHLAYLVNLAERQGRLETGVARRLERDISQLSDEARQSDEAG